MATSSFTQPHELCSLGKTEVLFFFFFFFSLESLGKTEVPFFFLARKVWEKQVPPLFFLLFFNPIKFGKNY